MKNNVFQLSHRITNIDRTRCTNNIQIGEMFLLMVCELISASLLCKRRANKILFVRDRFSFLYEDIWFDMTKCKFILKNSNLKCFRNFSPVFVADTKIV